MDVSAVLRETDPPLMSVGAVGAVGLATTIVIDTVACASVLGSGRDTGAFLCVGASQRKLRDLLRLGERRSRWSSGCVRMGGHG